MKVHELFDKNDNNYVNSNKIVKIENGEAKKLDQVLDEKASKGQIPWKVSTLENGWTGLFRYRLNSIGQLELNWRLIGGTIGGDTLVTTLPHAPSRIIPLTSSGSYTRRSIDAFYLNWDGKVHVSSQGLSAGVQYDGVVVIPIM